ncbi:hypothetical protein T492DRAFT_846634 [Pavlovales sp. CCMP2436]|nr:hypothetical protein T492DRAFT_846634 [Pavlovales sp. CCMP2436]
MLSYSSAERLRMRALRAAVKAWTPDVPVSFFVLGFDTTHTLMHAHTLKVADAAAVEVALRECAFFLKDHGAVLKLQAPAPPAHTEARSGGEGGVLLENREGGKAVAKSELLVDCKASRGHIVDQVT